jgi:uncharacterized protein (TIRG00374 family)
LERNNISTPPETRSRKDWQRVLPGVLISLVSLAIIFYLIKPQELIKALRLADYRLVVAGGLITLLWLVVRSLAWRTLLQEKASYRNVFFTVCEGYFLNNFLPLRLGEVGRAFLLARKSELSFWQVLSSILIERAIDMVFAAGLLLSTIPFVAGVPKARGAALAVGGVVILGLVILYLLARNPQGSLRLFERLTSRWSFLHRLAEQILPQFFAGLEVLTNSARFLRAISLFILNLSVAIAQFYIIMLAFFPHAHFLWALFVLAVSSLGLALPSSPGAVGVFEGAVIGALAVFGLDPSKAFAYAIVMHFWSYLLTGILGGFALARDGESITGLFKQLRGKDKG